MTEVFRKLNFKGQNPILVVAAPSSFDAERAAAAAETAVHGAPEQGVAYRFALAFAPMKADLVARAKELIAATAPDAIIWLAYPKKTSPNFDSDLDRDVCWKTLEPMGLSPNRQIAIDEDWSALRYKKA